MGCRQSEPMGNAINENGTKEELNEVKDIPKVDERIPLDARQVFKLKKSWKGIKRALGQTGVEMFIR